MPVPPKVTLVAVPPPVAPIDSVRVLSGEAPTPRAWLTPVPRPSAASAAAFDEEMLRSEVVPVWIESAPAATVDELGVAPDSASNFCSNCVTLSVTLIWLLPEAPEATKVMFWPFTVTVSPAAKLALSEFEEVEAAPDSSVAPVMARHRRWSCGPPCCWAAS